MIAAGCITFAPPAATVNFTVKTVMRKKWAERTAVPTSWETVQKRAFQ